MTATTWTPEAVRALGVVTDLTTAARIFKIGRTKAHEMRRQGALPFEVIVVGNRIVVPVAPLLALLGLDAVADRDVDADDA